MQTNRKRPRGTGSLVVRKNSRGEETWYGKWYGDRRQVFRRIGSKSELSRTEAGKLLIAMMGKEPDPEPQAADDGRAFAEAAEAHLDRLENKGTKQSTIRGYRSVIKAHLLPHFGARSVDAITEDDVATFDRLLKRTGLKPQSRRNIIGLLGAILMTAKKRGWTGSNPVAEYEKPRKSRSEPEELRFLKLEELEEVLRAFPDDNLGRVERTLVLTAGMTGLRRGELLGLRWKDVDWEGSTIRVVRTYVGGRVDTPKSALSRRNVPMADRVAADLDRLSKETPFRGENDPVFAHPQGQGNPLDGSAAGKAFKLALRRAGVREVRFHDLRHTFGTMMAADSRVSMRTLQGWLGHADPGTTAIYAHFAPNAEHAKWIGEAFTPSARTVEKEEVGA